jgi:hypothetical protein
VKYKLFFKTMTEFISFINKMLFCVLNHRDNVICEIKSSIFFILKQISTKWLCSHHCKNESRIWKQQCHISKILEMPQYPPRETPYLLREMPQLGWGMCISQGEGEFLVEDNGIPWRRCGVSRGICGISCERCCGISKILDMWHYSLKKRKNGCVHLFQISVESKLGKVFVLELAQFCIESTWLSHRILL